MTNFFEQAGHWADKISFVGKPSFQSLYRPPYRERSISWNVQYEYSEGQRRNSHFLPHTLSRLAHSPDSLDKEPPPLQALALAHKQWLEDINEVLALCASYEGSLSIVPTCGGLRFTQVFVSHAPKSESTVNFVAPWEDGLLCCLGKAVEHQAFDISDFLECTPATQQWVLNAVQKHPCSNNLGQELFAHVLEQEVEGMGTPSRRAKM